MALDLDGFAALKAIAIGNAAFSEVRTDAGKYARALTLAQMKRRPDLDSVRDVCGALGESFFGLIVDGMRDAEVASLLGKLDRHHPKLADADAQWRRHHLRTLAAGDAEPTTRTKPPKARGKSGKKGLAEAPAMLSSVAMATVRKR